MSEQQDARAIFVQVAELSAAEREQFFANNQVPAEMRKEIESLLAFDETRGNSFTGMVGAAAGQFLLSTAPVSAEGRCGAFRLVRLLGNGGMGAVYLADRADGEVQQRAAIKFLHNHIEVPSFRDRFLRERQIMASLNHPGIARLLDAGHTAGQPYLAMEYVDGVRIDEYTQGLDTRAIVALLIRVAEAVSYAHRNLVIHRDLKPSNILVDAAGNPKLLDFGIAKMMDTASQTSTMDRAHTPEYASPEQLCGQAQTTATDIYSLGAVLFRLLTGTSPRNANERAQLPRDLEAILAKAMRPEPEERYASADLLIADLKAFLEHRPVQARRADPIYATVKFLRRRWIPVAAAALAITGVVVGLVIANRQRTIAENRFQQVRRVSRQMLDLDGEIRNLPGATKARGHIVEASLDYLERLSASQPTDPDLTFEMAHAYLQVAHVQGVPTHSNLGQFKAAKETLKKAHRYVKIALTRPAGHRREALLVAAEIAHDSMILAQTERRNAEALAFAREADEHMTSSLGAGASEKPNVTADEAALAARMYSNLALSHSNMHYVEDSARLARRSYELAQLSGKPALIGKSLSVLSSAARFSGNLEEALRVATEATKRAEANYSPERSDSVMQLSSTLWRQGLILGEYNNISLQRPQEALPLLQRAYDLAESLARRDLEDFTSRSYLAMAARELGDVLRDDHPAQALAVYDHANRRLDEIPSNTTVVRDRVWLLSGSSYALRRLHRPAEARKRAEAALTAMRSQQACPGAALEPGNECDAALRAIANHSAETGDTQQAIRAYRDLESKIDAFKPHLETDLRHANAVSRLYLDLGNLYKQTGDHATAHTLYQRRLDIWRHWDAKLPNNVFVRAQVAATPDPGILTSQR